MKDRFDLEEEINELYNFVDLLDTLTKSIDEGLPKDGILKVIEGIKIMINLQAEKLHDTMSQCFKLDEYKDKMETEDYL